MSGNVIAIEERDGPFQIVFQRLLRMVPDREKSNKNLQRLLAFRLKIDGEAATAEYLVRNIRDYIKCGNHGSLYEFLRNTGVRDHCAPQLDPPPETA
ncbi:MAG: hypothetical protein ABIL58_02850 [Pseudomonadota bacterium]